MTRDPAPPDPPAPPPPSARPAPAAPRPDTPLRPLKQRAARNAWRRDLVKVWLPALLLTAAGFWVAWQFVEPAPPSTVRLATGAPGGGYERTGQRIAESFARRSVFLEPVPTAGSAENLRLLADGEVDAALIQGGTIDAFLASRPDEAPELQAVLSVDYELLLIAVRRAILPDPTKVVRRVDNPDLATLLTNADVAVGPEGSGTARLAHQLLAELGVSDGVTHVPPAVNDDALTGLRNGTCDVAFFVLSPDAPRVAELLSDPAVALLGLAQARGLAQRTAYLTPVVLARGVIDPARDLPATDLPTVAPTAYLAVRADTHRAVVQLLVRAAVEDQHPRLVGEPGTFPTLDRADLPVAAEARYFFERGPNVLHRTLPFWIASTVDRLAILLIPMLTVLIPLLRIAPPTLRWRIRRRIYRWYRQLRVIDDDLGRGGVPAERLAADRDQLRELDDEVSETDVPLSYMEEFYNLRLHIAYMRRRVDERLAGGPGAGDAGG